MSLLRLQEYFRGKAPMAVAVSGGVDSMTLAVVANREQPKTLIFHAISPAVQAAATARVRRYAEEEDWQLTIIDAGEMNDKQYLANPANRCYFCKTNLYGTVSAQTTLRVASGTNLDDLNDYRPGLEAAKEHDVCHPYVDLGICKTTLRAIAAELDLKDLQDLPAAPCLSSRVTTGIGIDAALLPIVDVAEQEVWRRLNLTHGVKAVRCRIRHQEVGLQIDTYRRLEPEVKAELIANVEDLFSQEGYANQVTRVLIEPYEMGSAFLLDTVELTE